MAYNNCALITCTQNSKCRVISMNIYIWIHQYTFILICIVYHIYYNNNNENSPTLLCPEWGAQPQLVLRIVLHFVYGLNRLRTIESHHMVLEYHGITTSRSQPLFFASEKYKEAQIFTVLYVTSMSCSIIHLLPPSCIVYFTYK